MSAVPIPISEERNRAAACVASREVPGFEIVEKQFPAGLTLSRHAHDRAHLVYGLEGSYVESYGGGRSAIYEPGLLRYLPRELEHANVFENGARCLIVSIDGALLERIAGNTRTLDRAIEIRSIASNWLAQRLHSEFRRNDPFSPVSLEGILLEILAEGARDSGAFHPAMTVPRWLRMARDYMEANFLRNLRLSEIARVAGVHRVHLAREFRRHFSVTVGEFLRQKRVEHACRLVSTTRDPLADVALACGFSDQSHFCATFRHHIGLTPGRFREMAQSR
jgi:AraC family transcriptional regulator